MGVLTFGKYSGMDLKDVPRDYVEWLREARRKDLTEYEAELERRDLVEQAKTTMLERIVAEGFKSLAKKCHPDMGGTDSEFRELKSAHEQLKVALGVLKTV